MNKLVYTELCVYFMQLSLTPTFHRELEIFSCLTRILLKLQIKRDFFHNLCLVKQAMTGVGVNLDTHTWGVLLKGSRRHLNIPPSLLHSLCSLLQPLARRSPLPLAAVVIGYDTGSTGRERGRIWMRRLSSSSPLFSNLLPCSSKPELTAVTVATSAWPHPPPSVFHIRAVSFIKIAHKCPNESVCIEVHCSRLLPA